MTAAAISALYANYKRFTISRVKAWKPKIHANLKQMIRNATDEPTIEAAIKNLDFNMLEPSGIAVTIQNIYKDAGRVWGGRIYQEVRKQAVSYERRATSKAKALLPIGYNEEIVNEIIAYFRVNLLNEAVLPITDTMKDWILQQVIRAQEEGRSIQQVADEMVKHDFPAKRAEVIARTETIKAANFGAVQGAKKTGLQTEKVWIAARDFRTRRIPRDEFSHAAMHGKTVPMDEVFWVPNRNGSLDALMQPGDPKGAAADVIQCRCTVGFNVIRGADGMPVREGAKPPLNIPPPPKPVQVTPPKPVFKPARTAKEAKEYAKQLLTDRYGLNIKSVSASSSLPIDQFNKHNEKLFKLTEEYNIAEVYNKGYPTTLKFASTKSLYGVIKTSDSGKNLHEINFGHITDSSNSRKLDIDAKLVRGKSRVDEENLDVSTLVHEFAHVIATERQTAHGNQIVNDFIKELRIFQKEYQNKLIDLYKNNDHKGLQLFSLGKYANTNLNEFMAEGFTEYKLSGNPSEYALKIGRLIDKYFKK